MELGQDNGQTGSESKGFFKGGKGFFGKKVSDNNDNGMGAEGKAKFLVKVNGQTFDGNDPEGRKLLGDFINKTATNLQGEINGQKIGTVGAQFEMSKFRAIAAGQATNMEEAKKIASTRGYVEGSKEATKSVKNFRGSGDTRNQPGKDDSRQSQGKQNGGDRGADGRDNQQSQQRESDNRQRQPAGSVR